MSLLNGILILEDKGCAKVGIQLVQIQWWTWLDVTAPSSTSQFSLHFNLHRCEINRIWIFEFFVGQVLPNQYSRAGKIEQWLRFLGSSTYDWLSPHCCPKIRNSASIRLFRWMWHTKSSLLNNAHVISKWSIRAVVPTMEKKRSKMRDRKR